MDTPLYRIFLILRNNLDKMLVAASGFTILVAGYFTLDYRSYTECQAQIMKASQATNVAFAESLRTLLSQPPRPADERRHAFEELQVALDHQQAVQEKLGSCQ
jgi:hypothetical protein